MAPVVDDEEREQTGAGRIEPPEISLVADEREEQGESVEDDVCLAILRQSLHLRRLDWDAAEPDDALDYNSGQKRSDGDPGESLGLAFQRHELLDRLLQNLEERDHHDDAED